MDLSLLLGVKLDPTPHPSLAWKSCPSLQEAVQLLSWIGLRARIPITFTPLYSSFQVDGFSCSITMKHAFLTNIPSRQSGSSQMFLRRLITVSSVRDFHMSNSYVTSLGRTHVPARRCSGHVSPTCTIHRSGYNHDVRWKYHRRRNCAGQLRLNSA
jgi:DNA-binding transcriptional regulator YdaS (Cro superfamily)